MIHADYLGRLADEVAGAFDAALVGVYLFGSAAYGADEPGVSDLDVQAVTSCVPTIEQRRALAQRISHAQLPCPARRLEFVLHDARAVAVAQRSQAWLMNFNTGAHAADKLSFDPSSEASHWFLLDIALGRRLGRALRGPPPAEVFAPIPRAWQLDAIVASLAWHRQHEPQSANTVLNAARGWRFALTGVHGSKRSAAQWVRQQQRWRKLVDAALRTRADGLALDATAVTAFLEHVEQQVHLTISSEA